MTAEPYNTILIAYGSYVETASPRRLLIIRVCWKKVRIQPSSLRHSICGKLQGLHQIVPTFLLILISLYLNLTVVPNIYLCTSLLCIKVSLSQF